MKHSEVVRLHEIEKRLMAAKTAISLHETGKDQLHDVAALQEFDERSIDDMEFLLSRILKGAYQRSAKKL